MTKFDSHLFFLEGNGCMDNCFIINVIIAQQSMVESSPKALQQFTTFKFILAVKTLNFRVRFFSALPINSTLKYSFITTSKIFNLLCMKVLHTYAIIFSAYVIFHFPILYNNSMSFHSWRTNSSFYLFTFTSILKTCYVVLRIMKKTTRKQPIA